MIRSSDLFQHPGFPILLGFSALYLRGLLKDSLSALIRHVKTLGQSPKTVVELLVKGTSTDSSTVLFLRYSYVMCSLPILLS